MAKLIKILASWRALSPHSTFIAIHKQLAFGEQVKLICVFALEMALVDILLAPVCKKHPRVLYA